jgi:hypothetical protein
LLAGDIAGRGLLPNIKVSRIEIPLILWSSDRGFELAVIEISSRSWILGAIVGWLLPR